MENRNDIDELKASLSITHVAEKLGLRIQNGKCRCFFPERHANGDRTPSVSFSEDKGLFRCFVCPDVRGDVIKLVELHERCSFREAVQWLREEFRPWTAEENALEKSKKESPNKNSPLSKSFSIGNPPEKVPEKIRQKVILSFLKKLEKVEKTPAAAWLTRRRIFRPVWEKMRLRYVGNYEMVSKSLLTEFGVELLQKIGLFNARGNLRYYKHRLIFPYLDKDFHPLYFQARTIEKETLPKEQNLLGTVPFPYNVMALDGSPGWVYLCEGVIDTLTLLGRNFNAVGIPGVSSFKAEWAPLFRNKNVVVCFDKDEAGRRGTEIVLDLLLHAGVHAIDAENYSNVPEAFRLKEGEDMNDKFGGRK